MAYKEPSQQEIDQSWEAQKREFLQAGLSELDFLRAQLGMALSGQPMATELQEARKRAFKALDQ